MSRFRRKGVTRHRQQILVDSLEARCMLSQTVWWSMDEGTGTKASDGSGSAISLTLSGSPAWQATGRVGGGLSFNNTTSQYASAATNVASSSTLSFSVWLRPTSLPSTAIPLDKTPIGASGQGWRLEVNSTGSVSWRIGSSTSFARITSPTGLASANNWVFVAATYNAGTATLYVNGTQAAQATGLAVSTADTTASFRVGMPSVFSSGFGFPGMVDDIKFYNTLLSPTAIARQYAVDQLPETTTQQKLKKAALGWAVEDAVRDEEAGFATSAANTYTDIANLLGSNIGTPQASPANLFAPIPNYATNPLVTAAVTQLTTLRNSTYHPPKDGARFLTNYSTGDVFGSWYDDAAQGTYALGQTQNPFYADPKLLLSTLRRFQGVIEGMPFNPNDFFLSADISQAYVLFNTVYPDLILPSKKISWETVLKADADNIIAQKATYYLSSDPTQTWFNNDIQQVTALRWYSVTFPTGNNYREVADSGMSLMLSTMFPDGAAPYVTYQNEVFTYHGIGVNMASRYWQAFGYQPARDLMTKQYWYYPLSIESPMVAEYSTASSWKHYWNQVTGADSAYIVASMNSSPENMAVYRMITNGGDATRLGNAATLNLASYYTTSVANGTVQDNYITYDRNLIGARGRFGRWSFSSTANPVKNDNRGKLTVVGAMYLDPGTSGWTLNAAVDSVGTRIRTNSAGTTIADATQNETNSYTVTDDFAAIATVGNPGPYKQNALLNWQGTQQWIQTANRMVGLVSIKSLTNQTSFAVNGAIDLVSGRATWGTQKLFTQVDSNTYSYGNLNIRIAATDYAAVSTYYDSTWGNDGANKSGIIRFSDASSVATGGTTASTYPAGFSQYYLVEIFPNTQAASSNLTRIIPGNGLTGFDLTDNGKNLRIIDNPTASTLTYTASITWAGGVTVHRSGEQYRPAFLSTYNPADTDFRGRFASPTQPYDIASGNITITIPPKTHIVLESNSAPTTATVAAATPSTVTATSTNLAVLGADSSGESDLTYTWSVVGTPPASVGFSANGTNTAKSVTASFSKAGTYNLLVTIADPGGLTSTSPVTVSVRQTATSLTLAPAAPTLAIAGSAQFSAVLTDQFTDAMSLTSPVWSATGGTVTSNGLFTAGAAPGAYSVTLNANGLSATNSGQILAPAPVGVSLAPSSDTGISGDNATRRNNNSPGNALSFVVSGSTAGATVRVFAGATLLGTAQATGSTTTVTTDGVTTIPDGQWTITSTQAVGAGPSSASSPVLLLGVDTLAPTLSLSNTPSGVTAAAVSSVGLSFSEPVYGLGLSAVSLTRDGGASALGVPQTPTTADQAAWTIPSLASVTANPGSYQLAVSSNGITDAVGNPLTTGASAGWVKNSLTGTAGSDTLAVSFTSATTANISTNGSPGYTLNLAPLPSLLIDSAGGTDSLGLTGTSPAIPLRLSGSISLGSAPADATLTVTGTGTVVAAQEFKLAGLAVEAGATARAIGGTGTASVLNALTIAPSGTFDLSSSDLVLKSTAAGLAGIQSLIAGNRLTTTSTTPLHTTLGAFVNDARDGTAYFSAYNGVTGLSADDVLVKYTYVGDTDLDGQLTAGDFGRVVEGFSTGQDGWGYGDVDNSGGPVNLADWTAFNAAYTYYQTHAQPNLGNGTAGGGGAGGGTPLGRGAVPGAPHLAFIGTALTNIVAGRDLGRLQVELRDADGKLATKVTSNVTVSVYSGPVGGKLVGDTTVRTRGGKAIFSNLSIRQAGVYTIAFSSVSHASAITDSFTVSAGAAARLSISSLPATVTATAPFAVSVTLQDRYGNTVADDTSIATLVLTSPSTAHSPVRRSTAFRSGTAVFSDVSLTTPGQYVLTTNTRGIVTTARKISVT